ncbi:hypothetical protein O3M35_013243 [Rhynocoris fuscipes]|uniref:Pseudouridine synthase II N-terminal domain-containing protein n=1 Tax=Rhynocoris fuscipes TaxID=488301 RepID=A0AAW1CEL8_9HEMI
MVQVLVDYAPNVWKLLNGLVCVYKPAGESAHRVRKSLLGKLSRELCEMDCREPTPFVEIEGDTTKPMSVTVRPNYADHPLVIGPRYVVEDFKCRWATYLGFNTSGVFLLGLNKGTYMAYKLNSKYPIRTYRLTAEMGYTTNNLFKTGKVVDRHSFNHVRLAFLENLLASIEATHQRNVFQICGVDIQSQEAYELAASGLVRPVNSKIPIVYSCKCVEFNPPEFTLEIQSINEYEAFLLALVHSIGLKLRTLATCISVQCIRHSFFTLDNALLKKHWTLQDVVTNIKNNQKLFNKINIINQTVMKTEEENNN